MTERPLRKILCVEDESDIRTIAEISLADIGGFELCLCASGREALAEVKKFRPDLILLDVMMPFMDGPETLSRLRADPDTAGIPVVYMTARVQLGEIEQYLASGAYDIIPKPFDPLHLPDKVREIWAQYREGSRSGKGRGRNGSS